MYLVKAFESKVGLDDVCAIVWTIVGDRISLALKARVTDPVEYATNTLEYGDPY
jgi:hypothetical protein